MNDRFLEDLKSRIDIVDVVRKYAELKKSGKNYMCRSPFRNERTPSFCVSQEKQFWYDFGNSEGGDVISFLEKAENINFQEAVEMISEMTGMEIPESFHTTKSSVSREDKKDIVTLHNDANEYFHQQLKKNKEAQKYLHDRGITDSVIDDWKLGYGGDDKDGLTKYLMGKGYSERLISQSGVAFERQFGDKAMMDRFAKRLMIPIREPKKGDIIAFTGRDLSGDKKAAKYINSPENPLYHKSSTLFGLDRARHAVRDQDAVILVEGNFDVISAHHAGITNTVATCGTSLTEDHLRLLKRSTNNFILAFDSDKAGKKATLRGVEMLTKMGLGSFIIEITGAKDLDEMVQKDPEKLKTIVKKPFHALEYLTEKFALKCLDGSIQGQKKFFDAIFFFTVLIQRPIERDHILEHIAKVSKKQKPLVEEEFAAFVRKHTQHKPKLIKETQKTQTLTREESFVGFMLLFKDKIDPSIQQKALELLSEDNAKNILQKNRNGIAMNPEETLLAQSWELSQGNMFSGTEANDVIQKHFESFTKSLQSKKERENTKSISTQRLIEALEKNDTSTK